MVCHISIRLSDADRLGASPSCRYGFSRKGVLAGVWLSRSAAANNDTTDRGIHFFTKIVSNGIRLEHLTLKRILKKRCVTKDSSYVTVHGRKMKIR